MKLPRNALGLVRINRLFNALDIHMPDPEPLMRSPAKGREQGGRGKPRLTNPTVSSNWRRGILRLFRAALV